MLNISGQAIAYELEKIKDDISNSIIKSKTEQYYKLKSIINALDVVIRIVDDDYVEETECTCDNNTDW